MGHADEGGGDGIGDIVPSSSWRRCIRLRALLSSGKWRLKPVAMRAAASFR